jgi:hypothetical protein
MHVLPRQRKKHEARCYGARKFVWHILVLVLVLRLSRRKQPPLFVATDAKSAAFSKEGGVFKGLLRLWL